MFWKEIIIICSRFKENWICQFNPPLKRPQDILVLKFKFIVIKCYKIDFLLLPRVLATKRLLFCAITVCQKSAPLSAMFLAW